MLRTIRGLAAAGLIAWALSTWISHVQIVDVSAQVAFAMYVPQFIFATSALLSFSAGLLALTLTIPLRQRPWSAALLVSLIFNGYSALAIYNDLWFVLIPTLANATAVPPFFIQFIFSALVPATPALLALGYTLRAARPAPPASQAPPAVEEQGSLDITIERADWE